jgi:hypothetical protein
MKSILSKRFVVDTTTFSLLFALILSCSYVSLASVNRPVGEILVSGASSAEGKTVTVNGEAAKSGRTIFDSSSIVTPPGQSAIVNLGKAGRLHVAPDSSVSIVVNGDVVTGSLSTGALTVIGSANPVSVTTASGEKVTVNSGESITATSSTASKKAQTGPGGLDWWVWAAIVGGAAAAVVLIVALNDDDDTNVTSPVR